MNSFQIFFALCTAHSLRFSYCHRDTPTIYFVQSEIPQEQKVRFKQLKNIHLPFNDANDAANIPMFLIAKILAEKVNITNLLNIDWRNPDVIKSFESKIDNVSSQDSSSTILTYFGLFFYQTYNPSFQWERFQGSSQKPVFIMTEVLYWNFLYCDTKHWKKEPV